MIEALEFIAALVGLILLSTLFWIAGFLVFVVFAVLFMRLADFLGNFVYWLIDRR